MANQNPFSHQQSGVIPYRIKDGAIEILMVTTRSLKHWTIPKGNISKGLSASESAEKEAYEEAGIQGAVIKPSIGFYTYEKHMELYRVKVFLMEVTCVLEEWPESEFRRRKWTSIKKARRKLKHNNLKPLLDHLESRAWF